jgi:hypothetical protein
MTVRDLVQAAILDLEGRIGTDDEEATDQDVLGLLNESDRIMR